MSQAKRKGNFNCADKSLPGKHHVDDYIRETGLPATFVYTGNFYENMVFRSHVQYDSERDMIEFRQPIILPGTKCTYESFILLACFSKRDNMTDESYRNSGHVVRRKRPGGNRQSHLRQLGLEAGKASA